MKLKQNIIVLLVVTNLLLIFMLIVKYKPEAFSDLSYNNEKNIVILDNPKKNKIKIDSSVLLNKNKSNNDKKKNAELFIDGDLIIGTDPLVISPEICLGDNCFSNNKLYDLVKYNIPYEVYETDSVEKKTPDKLCFNIDGTPNCITGDDIRVLNGSQPVYLAGPNDNLNETQLPDSKYKEGHLRQTVGPASHYYYDINNNYFEKTGYKHKQSIPAFTDPCKGWILCDYNKDMIRKTGDYNTNTYGNSGVEKVPYFYNLNKITSGVTPSIIDSINIDRKSKVCPDDRQGCNGDGILQMIKMPIHKTYGVDFDNDLSHSHNGKHSQDNQAMNVAAVNLLPAEFTGNIENKNVRDKIKYIMKPGSDTNLQCFNK